MSVQRHWLGVLLLGIAALAVGGVEFFHGGIWESRPESEVGLLPRHSGKPGKAVWTAGRAGAGQKVETTGAEDTQQQKPAKEKAVATLASTTHKQQKVQTFPPESEAQSESLSSESQSSSKERAGKPSNSFSSLSDSSKSVVLPEPFSSKAEVPKLVSPKIEFPKAEAPKAEAPKTEAQKTETPKTKALKTGTPKPAPLPPGLEFPSNVSKAPLPRADSTSSKASSNPAADASSKPSPGVSSKPNTGVSNTPAPGVSSKPAADASSKPSADASNRSKKLLQSNKAKGTWKAQAGQKEKPQPPSASSGLPSFDSGGSKKIRPTVPAPFPSLWPSKPASKFSGAASQAGQPAEPTRKTKSKEKTPTSSTKAFAKSDKAGWHAAGKQRPVFCKPKKVKPLSLQELGVARALLPPPHQASSKEEVHVRLSCLCPRTVEAGSSFLVRLKLENLKQTSSGTAVVALTSPKCLNELAVINTVPQAWWREEGLCWQVRQLDAGMKKEIQARLRAFQQGRLNLRARVFLTAKAAAVILVQKPKLALKIRPLMSTPKVHQPFPLEFVVQNTGSEPAEHVLLYVDLPPQLDYPYGRQLQYNVGRLAAGKSLRAKLTPRVLSLEPFVVHARLLQNGETICRASYSTKAPQPTGSATRSRPQVGSSPTAPFLKATNR